MFVGRETLLTEVLKGETGQRPMYDLYGGSGSGKTCLLRRLEEIGGGF